MPPLKALYTDLRTLGKIFDVEDRAEALVKGYEKQVAKVRAKIPAPGDRPSVFLYDDGRDKPLTSGFYAGPHDIITKAGGDHVMKDLKDSWTTVGWETVVARDPDVIVINDYGDTTAERKKAIPAVLRPAGERLGDQAPADLRHGLRRTRREPPQPRRDQRPGPLSARRTPRLTPTPYAPGVRPPTLAVW